MRWIRFFLRVAAVLAVGGCAMGGGTVGDCGGLSICPIVIYEKYPNVFATYPERAKINPSGKTTVIWTFADQTKYQFSATSGGPNGDGVEMIGKSNDEAGLTPCYITRDSKVRDKDALAGAYYRCEVVKGSTFNERYRIKFSAMDGSPRYVDPTVDTTGTGDVLGINGQPIRAASIQVLKVPVGTDASVSKPNPGDGVRIVFDAGNGNSFQRSDKLVVLSPPINRCIVATDADGTKEAIMMSDDGTITHNPGQYFACTTYSLDAVWTPPVSYTATYGDGAGNRTKTGKLTRP